MYYFFFKNISFTNLNKKVKSDTKKVKSDTKKVVIFTL